MDHLLYTELAEYYDVIYRRYLEETVPRTVEFVRSIFNRDARINVRRILDLACGTGGPTIELARRGYDVVGVDLHQEVIDIARRKASSLGNLNVTFIRSDVRKLNFREEFDAATMFFTSINYMTEFEDLVSLFETVRRAIRRGGVFIADAPNPLAFLRWHEGPIVWDAEMGDRKLLMIDYHDIEDVRCLVHFRRAITVIERDGSSKTYLMHDVIRLYTAQELRLAASMANFSQVKIYGDMKFEEPRKAKRLFLVALK